MPTISIEELLHGKLPDQQLIAIADWWRTNHPSVDIHYFRFKIPVYGGVIAPNAIALNTVNRDPALLTFLLAHEARHLDQYAEDPEGFMDGYFGTVERNDLNAFLVAYQRVEKDANDYAFDTMSGLGFDTFVARGQSLRSNERMGQAISGIIKSDIERTGADNLFDVIKSSII